MNKRSAILLITCFFLFNGCYKQVRKKNPPNPYADKILAAKVLLAVEEHQIVPLIEEWTRFGVDTVFVKEDLFTQKKFGEEIKKTDIQAFVIVQIFYNDNNGMDEDKPELDPWAITDDGKIAKPEQRNNWQAGWDWLEMVCPNHRAYREKTIDHIVEIVKTHQADGISLDFIRYFAFWEMVFAETDAADLPDTCFCETCIHKFIETAQIAFPADLSATKEKADWIRQNHPQAWETFKSDTITTFVKEIATAVKKENPTVQINIHGVPWRNRDFDGAITRITGQNYRELSKTADYISPMVYAKMLRRPPVWIHSVTADIAEQAADSKILPAFQVCGMYESGELTEAEFRKSIAAAYKDPSAGAIFWPWERLTDRQKEIMAEIFAIHQ